MSRGPGKVERAIEAAFTANPGATFSVEDLGPIVYPGINRVEKRHRVSIIRAAEKVAIRLWWRGWASERPGGAIIYLNLLHVRSYTLGRMRADYVCGAEPVGFLEALLDDPSSYDPWAWGQRYRARAQPGGAWWLHVEINKAEKAGDLAEADRLRGDLEVGIAKQVANYQATYGRVS